MLWGTKVVDGSSDYVRKRGEEATWSIERDSGSGRVFMFIAGLCGEGD